jgi:hypothetical protein
MRGQPESGIEAKPRQTNVWRPGRASARPAAAEWGFGAPA